MRIRAKLSVGEKNLSKKVGKRIGVPETSSNIKKVLQ